jgi:hypothetical protein
LPLHSRSASAPARAGRSRRFMQGLDKGHPGRAQTSAYQQRCTGKEGVVTSRHDPAAGFAAAGSGWRRRLRSVDYPRDLDHGPREAGGAWSPAPPLGSSDHDCPGFAYMMLKLIVAWLALQIPLGVFIGAFIQRGTGEPCTHIRATFKSCRRNDRRRRRAPIAAF